MKIFANIPPASGCDYHRITNPLQFMKDLEVVRDPYAADIFFFSRITAHSLESLRSKGVKIVLDIDDYWQLPEDHFFHENWRKGRITERIIEAMDIADAVITTNELLADKIRPHNRNVHVVPNALPYGHGQFRMQQSDWTGKIKFVGGKSHDKDIALLPSGPSYRIPGRIPVDRYMQHYDGVNIALAPLLDTEFNRCKSNLKILEAGAAYAHCLCSPVAPFLNAPVTYVDNGCWQAAIDSALQSPEYMQLCGQRLNIWCRDNYDLVNINVLRKRVFESL